MCGQVTSPEMVKHRLKVGSCVLCAIEVGRWENHMVW